MLWLLLAAWPLVALLLGCLLGRSVAIEERLADQYAPELSQGDPESAKADTGYALAEQG
jgi:hypothetical protein